MRCARTTASGQEVFELAGTEAGQPGLQADVRRERSLGLQAAQVPDGRQCWLRLAAQQQLAFQGGAVQLEQTEAARRHGQLGSRPERSRQ
jgi:hypothetical protein